ncbi:MAG: AAA family ATPase [Bacteroidales bacterium]|nr:AAA family ATPase [Bacteroidales bacterium]MDD4385318.1 AAA family ATPase [Bacteroidales bacterium]MDY0198264.1 AAA family ATPase [Tenuifilaceae bacterium]
MKKETINNLIVKNLGFDLTKSQEVTADLLSSYFLDRTDYHLFLLRGYAGTGKTSMIASCVKTLLACRIKVVLLAPTGRAAKVLSRYSNSPAFTVHKWIYRQKSERDGLGTFVLNKNMSKNTIFIVDEASMLSNTAADNSGFGSGRLLDDLLTFVNDGDNCRLILVGDDAQLPPIRLDFSPALNSRELQSYGYTVTEVILSEVVRQAQNSGILTNASLIRSFLDERRVEIPKFSLVGFDDIVRLSGTELVDSLEASYSSVGLDEAIVVCYSNKRANKYNQGIRNQLLWREEELSVGDLLMVVRNNYHWTEKVENINFIANGDVVKVLRIRGTKELHGFRFAEVTVQLIDYQEQELDVIIMLDTLSVEGPSLPMDKSNELYQSVALDYEDIVNKRSRMAKIKSDPYFNALQVKFAYAVTCHKAQGGQWKHVYLDQGFFKPEMMTREYLRWLYTAITRATEKVFLVNFSDDFYFEKNQFFE